MTLRTIGQAANLGALRRQGLAAFVVLFAVGCSSTHDAAKKALNPDPPAKMFADADKLLNRGSYSDAAKKFEDLDRDHPYSPEARRAMVMAAYAYYKAGKYTEAQAAGKRYTVMHPGTKDAALAHHIVASSNFDEIRDHRHDQTATRKALAELKLLMQRYPDSPYSKQAINRIRIAEDLLAASEMNVGRYYLNRQNYVGAINRFKVVVTRYQTTRHVEEALARLRHIAGRVPGAMFELHRDNAGRYSLPYASDALRDTCGFAPDDLRESVSPLVRIVHPDDRPGMLASIERSAADLVQWEYEFRLSEEGGAEDRWLQASAVPVRDGDGSIHWYGFAMDASVRKATEADAERLGRYLEKLGGFKDRSVTMRLTRQENTLTLETPGTIRATRSPIPSP